MKNGLIITNINMKLKSHEVVLAICNIELNGMFSINDVRLLRDTKKGGYFVAMPSKRMEDGKFRDMANPTNRDARQLIEKAVIQKYESMSTLGKDFFKKIG